MCGRSSHEKKGRGFCRGGFEVQRLAALRRVGSFEVFIGGQAAVSEPEERTALQPAL